MLLVLFPGSLRSPLLLLCNHIPASISFPVRGFHQQLSLEYASRLPGALSFSEVLEISVSHTTHPVPQQLTASKYLVNNTKAQPSFTSVGQILSCLDSNASHEIRWRMGLQLTLSSSLASLSLMYFPHSRTSFDWECLLNKPLEYVL